MKGDQRKPAGRVFQPKGRPEQAHRNVGLNPSLLHKSLPWLPKLDYVSLSHTHSALSSPLQHSLVLFKSWPGTGKPPAGRDRVYLHHPPCPQHLIQYPAHSRCSINMCDWMKEGTKEESACFSKISNTYGQHSGVVGSELPRSQPKWHWGWIL